MIRTHRRRLSWHHHANRQQSSGSNRSASSTICTSSRSSSLFVLKSKCRRVDFQVAEEDKRVFRDKEDEEALVT